MFQEISEIEKYFVYCYHHLDDLSFLRDPEQFFADHPLFAFGGAKHKVEDWVNKVGKLMRKHGWEGDGEIQIDVVSPICADCR